MPVGKDGYDAKINNLEEFFGTEHSVAYLKTEVWIEKSEPVIFELGSDDGIKLWLNGSLVHEHKVERGHNQGDDVVELSLEEGWNKVLMKITQGTGGWGASLVITDLDHDPMEGLKY